MSTFDINCHLAYSQRQHIFHSSFFPVLLKQDVFWIFVIMMNCHDLTWRTEFSQPFSSILHNKNGMGKAQVELHKHKSKLCFLNILHSLVLHYALSSTIMTCCQRKIVKLYMRS